MSKAAAQTMQQDTRARMVPVELIRMTAEILAAAGLSADHARRVAELLVFAQESGIDSHGVAHLPAYVAGLVSGALKARPDMHFDSSFGATCVLDADRALGPLAGLMACDHAHDRAAQFGVGVVAVRNSSHFGVASAFANYLAEKGMVSLILSNASATVAPRGSRTALFGTNPIAAGFPRANGSPALIDFATTAGARGRIRKAAKDKEPIPADWALDADGKPTTDAQAALGGTMQALGGEKGTVLPMVVELLCVALSGGVLGADILTPQEPSDRPRGISHLFIAIDTKGFGGLSAVGSRTAAIASSVEHSSPAEGVDAVRMPGARGGALRARARQEGIEISAGIRAALDEARLLTKDIQK